MAKVQSSMSEIQSSMSEIQSTMSKQYNGENVITIFSLRVVKLLINKGFNIIDIQRNKTNGKYLVFHFKDSNELRNVLEQL